MAKLVAPRFGIGEWYGRSFVHLSHDERQQLANIALNHTKATAPPCPFIPGTPPCSKNGGVCSLRLYGQVESYPITATAVAGVNGDLRTTCPNRFKQDGIIYREIGTSLLGTTTPLVVHEIRFLQRLTASDDDAPSSEDVGNIDNVLVHPDLSLLRWCALEIQAVYFSGVNMASLFRYIANYKPPAIPFPDATRRPDYRSSGPKRLMPQLQIKVPTLRRWGKKMAVVVDAAWFRSNVINVETVSDVSNCDIAWFVVQYDETTNPAKIVVSDPEKHTLERAVEGLTGGVPVTLSEFESKIRSKLNSPPSNPRKIPSD